MATNVKTQDEIEAMIVKIEREKITLPERSMFGDPNHKIRDMQIAILNREYATREDLYDAVDDSEIHEEHEAQITLAFDWLEGDLPDSELVDDDDDDED